MLKNLQKNFKKYWINLSWNIWIKFKRIKSFEPEINLSDEDFVIKFLVKMMDLKVKATINKKNIPDDNIKYLETNIKDNFEIKVISP